MTRKPDRPARVVVVGTSGSGKTTLANQVAEKLNLKHVELDAIFWQPNWTPQEESELERLVRKAVAQDRWVIDGNYSRLRTIIWPRATHVVWIDFQFMRVMWQLFRRTIRRSVSGEELFGRNKESLRMAFLSRDSILLWGLTTFHRRRRGYQRVLKQDRYPGIEYIVLKTPRQLEEWLKSL